MLIELHIQAGSEGFRPARGAPMDCPKRQRFDRARMVKQSVPDEMSDVKTIKFAHAITI